MSPSQCIVGHAVLYSNQDWLKPASTTVTQARLEAASEGIRAGPDDAALQTKQAEIQAKLPA